MDYESDKEAKNTDTSYDVGMKLRDHQGCSDCTIKDSDKEIMNDTTVSDKINQEIKRRTSEDRSSTCNNGSSNCVIASGDLEKCHNEIVVTNEEIGDQIATSDDYCQDHHALIAATDAISVTSTNNNTKTATTTCEQSSFPESVQGEEWKDSSSSLKRLPVTPQTLLKDPTCAFHEETLFISSNETPIEESTSALPEIKIIANHSDSFKSLSHPTTEQYLNTDMIDDAATSATKPNAFELANSSKNLSSQLGIEDNHEVPSNTLKDEVLIVSELNQNQLDPELDMNMTYKFTTGTPSLKGIESPKDYQNLTIAHPHPLSSQIATPTSISSSSSPLQKSTYSATFGSAPSTSSSSIQIQDPSSSPPHISQRSTRALTQGKSIPLQFSGSSSSSSNCSHSSPTRTETIPTSQPKSKDILLAELKSIRIASITARNTALENELLNKRARLEEITRELEAPASETVRRHIKLLHDYNDIRDIGQSLIGMIAEQRGVQIGSLYDDFGVGIKD